MSPEVVTLRKTETDNSVYRGVEEVKERAKGVPVCLIIPPSTFLADERVFPFLGILKVAAELRKNGNPVEVLDLSGYGNYLDIVSDFAKTAKAHHFALTATTPQLPATIKIAETLRNKLKNPTITLGGPHVTLAYSGMRQDAIKRRYGRGTMAFEQLTGAFDKLVIGDGELAIFHAIDPDSDQKVIDAGNRNSPLFLKRGTLESFEYPARDLIDMSSYHYYIDGHRTFSAIAQLGCPFECGFCGGRDSHFLRTTRPRIPQHAIAEIEQYILEARKEGIDYSGVMFYDDELNVSIGNLESLCRELIELQERLGIEMAFRGFVKAELFTPQQARLMYHAGFRVLLSGIESGSDLILKSMQKHTSRALNSHFVSIAHEAGLRVKALMSLGHPGESERTVKESLDWVRTNLWRDWDDVDWTVITQYPGSPYFDRSEHDAERKAWRYAIKVDGEEQALWSREADFAKDAYYYKGVPGEYQVYVWTDDLSAERLAQLRDRAEAETRSLLNLPPITAITPQTFEHSMGQSLPKNILRESGVIYEAR